jgi:transposase-like protein
VTIGGISGESSAFADRLNPPNAITATSSEKHIRPTRFPYLFVDASSLQLNQAHLISIQNYIAVNIV